MDRWRGHCGLASRSLKHHAKKALGLTTAKQALTGAVSVIQRGNSALRLNVHFHVLVLDRVYVRGASGAQNTH